MNHDSPVALCCVPKRPVAPEMDRIVTGTAHWPPDMNRYLGSWLMIWSPALGRKSLNMNSTTGRIPRSAMPNATPVNPFSQIGVLSTWPGNVSARPSFVLNTPPLTPPSSPINTTLGSAVISSLIAKVLASRYVHLAHQG